MKMIALLLALFVLAGCAALQEQRTMRIVYCASAAPVITVGGARVSGLDVIAAVRDRQPERIVLMADSGAMALIAGVMAQALKQDAAISRGVEFADGDADRAQAARLCSAGR